MSMKRSTIAIAMLVSVTMAPTATAQSLAASSASQTETSVVLSLADIKVLPKTSFKTSTIWTEGVNSFTGVLLSDFLEAAKAEGEALQVIALNDYAVDIPVSDAVADGPIIAYQMNGEEMSVRERGPYWLVYPYDSKAEYRSETIYSRSIWQISRIKLR